MTKKSKINLVIKISIYFIALSIGGICLSFMVGCTNPHKGILLLILSFAVGFISSACLIVGFNKMDKL